MVGKNESRALTSRLVAGRKKLYRDKNARSKQQQREREREGENEEENTADLNSSFLRCP